MALFVLTGLQVDPGGDTHRDQHQHDLRHDHNNGDAIVGVLRREREREVCGASCSKCVYDAANNAPGTCTTCKNSTYLCQRTCFGLTSCHGTDHR